MWFDYFTYPEMSLSRQYVIQTVTKPLLFKTVTGMHALSSDRTRIAIVGSHVYFGKTLTFMLKLKLSKNWFGLVYQINFKI